MVRLLSATHDARFYGQCLVGGGGVHAKAESPVVEVRAEGSDARLYVNARDRPGPPRGMDRKAGRKTKGSSRVGASWRSLTSGWKINYPMGRAQLPAFLLSVEGRDMRPNMRPETARKVSPP